MRTTLTLDRDIYEAAMHLAKASGRSLGAVVSEMARRGIQRQSSVPSRARSSRFPVVDVPPDAPVIPASRVDRYLDEEGYI